MFPASTDDFSWLAFFDATLKTLESFEYYFSQGSRRNQSRKAQEHGCFRNVSLDAKLFLRDLHKARTILDILKPNRKTTRFLDVGCGVGVKVHLASHIFSVAHGLEYDRGYLRAAQALRKATLGYGTDFFHADALTFDGFGAYDVVYLYRPMKDLAKQSDLEKKIATNLKKDAILIAHLCSFRQFHPPQDSPDAVGLEPLFDTIFVNTSPRRLEQLKIALAERTRHLSTVWW